MGPIASQITSLTIVYSTVYSDADQIKHQSSASLSFVYGIHRGHKWPVTRKCFHLMTSSCYCNGITVIVREHQVTALKTASRFLNINDTLIIYSLWIFTGLKNINSIGSVMSHNKSIFYYTDKWIHYHSDCLVPSTFPKHFNSLRPSKRIPCDYWLDLCPQCRSVRCSWSITCRRCSNYIFILDLTFGSKGFGKDSRKTVRESFKCWDLVHLILETLR